MSLATGRVRTRFPTTRWSLLDACREEDLRSGAVAEFLGQYAEAMRSYVAAFFRLPEADVDDIVQSFIVDKILIGHILARADRGRGNFRAFLGRSLQNYTRSWLRRSKRTAHVNLENAPNSAVVLDVDPFDVAWARQIIAKTLECLEIECLERGREDIWEVLQGRVIRPSLEATTPESYTSLAPRCGAMSAGKASNLLMSGKRAFVRVLRRLIGEYATDEAEIKRELVDLQRVSTCMPPA